jgi:hypothetical protein
MVDQGPSFAGLAGALEGEAIDLLKEGATHGIDAAADLTPQMKQQILIADAHARATLALSLRTAELAAAVGDGLEGIRSDGVGVG